MLWSPTKLEWVFCRDHKQRWREKVLQVQLEPVGFAEKNKKVRSEVVMEQLLWRGENNTGWIHVQAHFSSTVQVLSLGCDTVEGDKHTG